MFPVSSVSGEFLKLGDRKISNMQKTSIFADPITYINNWDIIQPLVLPIHLVENEEDDMIC